MRPEHHGSVRSGRRELLDGAAQNERAFRLDATEAKAANTVRCFVVMLDDVGDIPGKSVCPLDRLMALPLKPHAYVVTRIDGEGRKNGQALYFIVPDTIERAVALVRALGRAGWCDRHASGGVRWARPPGSIKVDADGTRHTARLLIFNPMLPQLSIDALASLFDIALNEESAPSRAGPCSVRGRHPRPPAAEIVASAMSAISNHDLIRSDWVKIGLALKASEGDPPALSDSEAFELFDRFSRQHPSYRVETTRRFWESANPERLSFGTIVLAARRCGWTGAEREFLTRDTYTAGFDALVVPDEATAERAWKLFGGRRVFVVKLALLPWFQPDPFSLGGPRQTAAPPARAPTAAVKCVLASAPVDGPEALAWLGDIHWYLGRRGIMVRLRVLEEPQRGRGVSILTTDTTDSRAAIPDLRRGAPHPTSRPSDDGASVVDPLRLMEHRDERDS